MKVVVCWAGMQGYVAACLRALNKIPGIDLHVLHLDFDDLPFQEELLHEVSNQRFTAADANSGIPALVAARQPEVVFLCGWFYRPYRQLIDRPELQNARFVLGMDTPWTGSWQQRLNRYRLRRFMRRMDKVVVAGPKSADLARRLQIAPARVVVGLYGFDFDGFRDGGGRLLDEAPGWPRRFLFAGRYAQVKGIDVLVEAYAQYRLLVDDPWPLDCCGTGPEAHLLEGVGIRDLGYVQPSSLPRVFGEHGVFLMPSRVEPWGVAIAEAAATGLPLICTDVCGAAADLLRSYYNGVTVPPGDPRALAEGMAWMHRHYAELPVMGRRSRNLAHAFSAEAWAGRLHACFTGAIDSAARSVGSR